MGHASQIYDYDKIYYNHFIYHCSTHYAAMQMKNSKISTSAIIQEQQKLQASSYYIKPISYASHAHNYCGHPTSFQVIDSSTSHQVESSAILSHTELSYITSFPVDSSAMYVISLTVESSATYITNHPAERVEPYTVECSTTITSHPCQ